MSILTQEVLKSVKWDRSTINASFLSVEFVEFFKGAPWDEYLMCPRCKDPNDYGPSHTYGIEEVTSKSLRTCPICGLKLELFWSPKRVMNYLFRNPESDGIVIVVGSEIAAWCRGYPKEDGYFYIDTIAAMPKFRRKIKTFLEEFKKFLDKKRLEGFRHFKTRTHQDAKNVQSLLRYIGFREGEPSEKNPKRIYWYLD